MAHEPQLAAMVRAVADGNAETERTFKQDRRSTVRLVRHGDDRCVVKTYHLSRVVSMMYGLLGMNTAQRERRAAERLHAIGIRTLLPVLVPGSETLLYPYVEAPTLQDAIGQIEDADTRLRVACATGGQLGRLTAAGYINRDHKPTNLLVDAACREQNQQPVLIDPLGLRQRPAGKRGRNRTLEMCHIMLRASARAGAVSTREKVAFLRSAIAADPSLADGRSAATVAREIGQMAAARPLSYDPDDLLN